MIDVSGGKSSIKNSVAIMSSGDVFVINLCASMTPMPSVPKSLKGYEEHRLYQVTHVEDGRHRYRLRLGFFNTEADAELAVASLRSLYPAAFTSRAGAEDMRYSGDPLLTGRFTARAPAAPAAEIKPSVTTTLASAQPKHEAVQTPPKAAPRSPAASVNHIAASTPMASVQQPVIKPAAAPAKPAATQPSLELTAQSLLDMEMPAKERSTPFTMTTHQPFHVARGVDLPDTDLELAPTIIPIPVKKPESKAPAMQPAASRPPVQVQTGNKQKVAAPVSLPIPKAAAAKTAPPPQVSKSIAALAQTATKRAAPAASPPPVVATKPVSPAPKPAQPQPSLTTSTNSRPGAPKVTDDYVPILDTTMTIRTISLAEMEDENQPKWFAVQLAMSEQPFNLDAMPRLDIFAAYRVYSVVVNGDDAKTKHSLRLGFFKEEVSADAVSGYLKTFFPSPIITRVGIAEYERFLEPKTAPPAEPENKVVSLNEKRDHVAEPSKPTFGVNPAPSPARAKPAPAGNAQKRETTQPGLRRPSGKYSIAAIKKNNAAASTADSGIRHGISRPQSFLSKLIGRELD